MRVMQPTLAEGVLPLAEEVMDRAQQRASDEGVRSWSRRHHEIIREEWLLTYPDADDRSREVLDEAVRRAKT